MPLSHGGKPVENGEHGKGEIRTVRGCLLTEFRTPTWSLSSQAGHQPSKPNVISELEQELTLRKGELPGCISLGKCQDARTDNICQSVNRIVGSLERPAPTDCVFYEDGVTVPMRVVLCHSSLYPGLAGGDGHTHVAFVHCQEPLSIWKC